MATEQSPAGDYSPLASLATALWCKVAAFLRKFSAIAE